MPLRVKSTFGAVPFAFALIAPGFNPFGFATVPPGLAALIRLAAGALFPSFAITFSPATVRAVRPLITPPAPAAFIVCVARLFPDAVFNLPPLAVAPLPPLLANLPRLSRTYLRAMVS